MNTTISLPISSSTRLRDMSDDIPCAFDGNIHWIDTCDGDAVVFFRTAKGTIWPLCKPCAERFKTTAVQLVADQRVDVGNAVGASFDIPLSDAETREAFRAQDPQRIQRVLDKADALVPRKKS